MVAAASYEDGLSAIRLNAAAPGESAINSVPRTFEDGCVASEWRKSVSHDSPDRPLPTHRSLQEYSLQEYSAHLAALLALVLEKSADDSSRMQYEAELRELTAAVPHYRGDPEQRTYPADYLSAVLMECYLPLLELTSLYFNLAFSSHITQWLVSVVYSLECWEIYHLLQVVPSISYFLRLVDIGLTETPLGPIVSPPQNLMSFNLRQGLQYPFPFPAYHFSFHTSDPYALARKYARVRISPYIDIRLKPHNTRAAAPRKPGRAKTDPHWRHPSPLARGPTRRVLARNARASGTESDSEGQARAKIYTFMEYTPRLIELEFQMLKARGDVDEDDDSDTDTDSGSLPDHMDVASVEAAAAPKKKHVFIASKYGPTGVAGPKGPKVPAVHQCQKIDPTSGLPCLKIFYGKNELQRHEEFVHATFKKIFRCIYCEQQGNRDQCYPRHDSLARHIRRKHGVTGRENKMAVEVAKKNAEIVELPQPGHAPTTKPVVPGPPAGKDSASPPPEPMARFGPYPYRQEMAFTLPLLADIKPLQQMPYGTNMAPLPYPGMQVAVPGVLGLLGIPQPWYPQQPMMGEASKKPIANAGFQKFRFPNNYCPPSTTLYGSVYGSKNMFIHSPFLIQPPGSVSGMSPGLPGRASGPGSGAPDHLGLQEATDSERAATKDNDET